MLQKARHQRLLRADKRRLIREHRKARRLQEKGYRLQTIAQQMQLTEDDVFELLREKPC